MEREDVRMKGRAYSYALPKPCAKKLVLDLSTHWALSTNLPDASLLMVQHMWGGNPIGKKQREP